VESEVSHENFVRPSAYNLIFRRRYFVRAIVPQERRIKMNTTSYARYHAGCWAGNKTIAELREEIARVGHKARTYHYRLDEIGNTTADWARHDRLVEILAEVEKSPILTTGL
jgi:hypothetical protein